MIGYLDFRVEDAAVLATVKARDGEILIPLNDGEMGDLLRVSEGRAVSARFGTRGAALVLNEACWAIPFLVEWRGVAFSDGAGI